MAHRFTTQRWFRTLCLCLAWVVGGDGAMADSSVRVSRSHQLLIAEGYETILSRLDGKEPTERMFRSQGAQLLSYQPREANQNDEAYQEKASKQKNNEDGAHAVIDIGAYSLEHGAMDYIMTIDAKKKLTIIDVLLTRPAGMVVGQHYLFTIEPQDDRHCSIAICHTLDIHLTERKMEWLNRLITKITCKESNKQTVRLTNAMARCVASIVSQKSETRSQIDASSSDSDTSEKPQNAGGANPKDNEPSSDESTNSEPAANQGTENDSSEDAKSKLTFQVKLTGNGKGSVRLAIFQSKEEFEKFDARKPEKDQGDAFRKKEFVLSNKNKDSVECVFDDVPFGKYVVAAFYDKDSNQRLNASFIGLPSEPYGFSKEARGTLGPPRFEDAVIEFDKGNQSFTFTLK